MSIEIGAFEAKTKFSEILDRVARGEEIVVTRHDKPVARIVPAVGISLNEVRSTIAQLREFRKANILNPPGEEPLLVCDLVAEGRR